MWHAGRRGPSGPEWSHPDPAGRGDVRRPDIGWLSQGPERGAEFGGEQCRLLPGGEVATPVKLVEVDEVGVGPLGPAAGNLVDLMCEGAHGGRDGHTLDVEEADRVLPV